MDAISFVVVCSYMRYWNRYILTGCILSADKIFKTFLIIRVCNLYFLGSVVFTYMYDDVVQFFRHQNN